MQQQTSPGKVSLATKFDYNPDGLNFVDGGQFNKELHGRSLILLKKSYQGQKKL